MAWDRVTALSIAMSLLSCAGCGSDGLTPIPVSGKITFDGGPCPADGTIAFSPIATEEGVPRRPGTAQFKADGLFEATSFNEGDGLLPGRYRAIVSCWKGEPSNDDPSSFERLNYVPRDYKPSEIVVARSAERVEVILDVP